MAGINRAGSARQLAALLIMMLLARGRRSSSGDTCAVGVFAAVKTLYQRFTARLRAGFGRAADELDADRLLRAERQSTRITQSEKKARWACRGVGAHRHVRTRTACCSDSSCSP